MATRNKTGDGEQRALHELFVIIVARDIAGAARVLRSAPSLARCPAIFGATRQDPKSAYFEAINHYAYAGDTPLHMAAASHEPVITRALISAGADVRARNRRGAEPLHYAADGIPGSPQWDPSGQSAVIAALAQAGGDANAVDDSGVAPLHRAVRARCAAAVAALLTNGAEPRLRNGSGSTPLHLAVQNTGRGGTGSPLSQRQQAAIIEHLLEHGAVISDKNHAGKTVQECAAGEWLSLLSDRAP